MHRVLSIKGIIIGLFILGISLIRLGLTQPNQEIPSPVTSDQNKETLGTSVSSSDNFNQEIKVVRVVDGDTIEVEGGLKVRYIGIDTPETVDPRRPIGCFGKEASEANKKLVERKWVYLEKDISDTDKYERLLRYVYLKDENGNMIFVNDYLVRSGFAKASTYPPDVKFTDQFVQAEAEAREEKRGLWQKCF